MRGKSRPADAWPGGWVSDRRAERAGAQSSPPCSLNSLPTARISSRMAVFYDPFTPPRDRAWVGWRIKSANWPVKNHMKIPEEGKSTKGSLEIREFIAGGHLSDRHG